MLNITLAQFKTDITRMMKGTSLNQLTDFYGTAAGAAGRMLARIDTEETRRIATLASPFYDNVNSYVIATDYKGMIDIRRQENLSYNDPGRSMFSETTARQFRSNLSPDSFSIRWNNMVRTLQAQVLPSGNCYVMDAFDGPSSNGLWVSSVDASGLYTEPLNYVSGNSSLGLNLSGSTGIGTITNTTVPAALDLSAYLNEDASMLFVYIPPGYSSRFTSFGIVRGDSASVYRTVTVTTKADGTAFSDGWNMLLVNWATGINTGTPTNTSNQYRKITANYTAGTAISGVLIDNWSGSLGVLYEMEYYSECLFRTSAGAWIYAPTDDTDLINVGPAAYEILKQEMMIDVVKIIRTGKVQAEELADLRLMLNGQSQNRYVKDPPYHGLYADYLSKYPSSRIVTTTTTYNFDL